MLIKLSVENYALIEHLELEWDAGLNIITGQTGAGKSILLGALGLVVGDKADVTALKDNAVNCVVEGEFDLTGHGLEQFFDDNDIEYSDRTVVRRLISPSGRSRAYVNDVPVQLATLKELGSKLIDIHSQHQSLMVGNADFRMKIIDGVADDVAELAAYREAFNRWRQCERRLAELRDEARRNKNDEEYVRFQYEQLSSLHLHEGELAELENEQNELSNTEQIGDALGVSAELLDADETGVLVALKAVEQNLHRIADVYADAGELFDRVHASAVELRDIADTLSLGAQRIEANPQRLEEVSGRLDAIYTLFQKHHVDSVEALMGLEREFAARLEMITDSDEMIAEAAKQAETTHTAAVELAAIVSAKRVKAAGELSEGIETMLARLGFEGARFVCDVTPLETLQESGADATAFMFSANRSSSLQPVEKIASGGEISRVMLCLKAFVAKSTKLPTIIFDEIDSGISGRIADVTGEIIAELSESMQVVNITHLPQVASKGRTHFMVYKQDEADGVKTHIRRLSDEERVSEIAKMLSGSKVTEAATEQAKSLLNFNNL